MEAGVAGLILGGLSLLVAAGNALLNRKKFDLDLFEAALAEVRTERDECRKDRKKDQRERAEYRRMLVDNGLLPK